MNNSNPFYNALSQYDSYLKEKGLREAFNSTPKQTNPFDYDGIGAEVNDAYEKLAQQDAKYNTYGPSDKVLKLNKVIQRFYNVNKDRYSNEDFDNYRKQTISNLVQKGYGIDDANKIWSTIAEQKFGDKYTDKQAALDKQNAINVFKAKYPGNLLTKLVGSGSSTKGTKDYKVVTKDNNFDAASLKEWLLDPKTQHLTGATSHVPFSDVGLAHYISNHYGGIPVDNANFITSAIQGLNEKLHEKGLPPVNTQTAKNLLLSATNTGKKGYGEFNGIMSNTFKEEIKTPEDLSLRLLKIMNAEGLSNNTSERSRKNAASQAAAVNSLLHNTQYKKDYSTLEKRLKDIDSKIGSRRKVGFVGLNDINKIYDGTFDKLDTPETQPKEQTTNKSENTAISEIIAKMEKDKKDRANDPMPKDLTGQTIYNLLAQLHKKNGEDNIPIRLPKFKTQEQKVNYANFLKQQLGIPSQPEINFKTPADGQPIPVIKDESTSSINNSNKHLFKSQVNNTVKKLINNLPPEEKAKVKAIAENQGTSMVRAYRIYVSTLKNESKIPASDVGDLVVLGGKG